MRLFLCGFIYFQIFNISVHNFDNAFLVFFSSNIIKVNLFSFKIQSTHQIIHILFLRFTLVVFLVVLHQYVCIYWSWIRFIISLCIINIKMFICYPVGTWIWQISFISKARRIRRHNCLCLSKAYYIFSPTSRAEACFSCPARSCPSDGIACSS